MSPSHYAKEAQRLLDDDVLKFALNVVRKDALEALATADAANLTTILRLQQKVAVIDEIRAELSGAIHRLPNEANPSGTFA